MCEYYTLGISSSTASIGDGGYVITPAPEAPAPTFELSLSQIDCIVGDTDQLSPKSLPNIGDATLTWRSEDSKIVAVDNNVAIVVYGNVILGVHLVLGLYTVDYQIAIFV